MKKVLIWIYKELIEPGAINIEDKLEIYLRDRQETKKKKRMDKAIKRANKLALATRKTHYVLIDYLGYPYVANKEDIRFYQRAGYYHRKKEFTIEELLKSACYIARGRNGGPIEEIKK